MDGTDADEVGAELVRCGALALAAPRHAYVTARSERSAESSSICLRLSIISGYRSANSCRRSRSDLRLRLAMLADSSCRFKAASDDDVAMVLETLRLADASVVRLISCCLPDAC